MKTSENGFGHFLVMLVFIVTVCIAAGIGWLVYERQYANHTNSSSHTISGETSATTSSHSMTRPTTANEIVTAVHLALSKKYVVDPSGNDTTQGIILKNHIRFMIQQPFLSPYWQSKGYQFYNNSATYSGLGFWFNTAAPSSNAAPYALTDIQNFLVNQLVSFGLAAVNPNNPVMQEQGYANPLLYISKQAVCVVQTELDGSAGMSCANFTDYAASAANLKPFAAAYAAVYPNDQGDAIFQASLNPKSPSITVQSNGYQAAAVEMADSWAYFYQVNGAWHFLYSTQIGLSCDFSKYPEAKPAFIGQPCIDTAGKSSVVK